MSKDLRNCFVRFNESVFSKEQAQQFVDTVNKQFGRPAAHMTTAQETKTGSLPQGVQCVTVGCEVLEQLQIEGRLKNGEALLKASPTLSKFIAQPSQCFTDEAGLKAIANTLGYDHVQLIAGTEAQIQGNQATGKKPVNVVVIELDSSERNLKQADITFALPDNVKISKDGKTINIAGGAKEANGAAANELVEAAKKDRPSLAATMIFDPTSPPAFPIAPGISLPWKEAGPAGATHAVPGTTPTAQPAKAAGEGRKQ